MVHRPANLFQFPFLFPFQSTVQLEFCLFIETLYYTCTASPHHLALLILHCLPLASRFPTTLCALCVPAVHVVFCYIDNVPRNRPGCQGCEGQQFYFNLANAIISSKPTTVEAQIDCTNKFDSPTDDRQIDRPSDRT